MDEKKSKKEADMLGEELDAMGQESETKAVKWVQEVENKQQKEDKEKEADELTVLYAKRKYKKNPYFEALYALAKRRMSEYDIPRGYTIDCILKEDGRIIFGLQKVNYRWYAKGMKICGEPKYDINCIDRLIVQLMISLDELQHQHEQHKTQSGIYLPPKSN